MHIFDAHAHLGIDVVFDVEGDEQLLLDTYTASGIHGALIQPFINRPYLVDTAAIHDRIAAFAASHPGRFWGMVSINPHLNHADIERESERCVKKLGFRGVKIATTATGTPPVSRDGMHIFEVAQALGIAVMIHTGGGTFAEPDCIRGALDAFPGVTTVLAHGGGVGGVDALIALAKRYDQVYLEPSWVKADGLRKLLAAVGAERIMYSSDMPGNAAPALLDFQQACGANDAALEQMLCRTAKQAFSI